MVRSDDIAPRELRSTQAVRAIAALLVAALRLLAPLVYAGAEKPLSRILK